MAKIKRLVNFIIPVEACNFRCHYCFVAQDGRNTGHIGKLKYSLDYIQKAMTVERWGGVCHLSICALGETLIPDYTVELARRLLENGHYISIVTNGTLTNRIKSLCRLPEKLKNHLFLKFSFHYLQLKDRDMFDVFFNNVRCTKDAGISFTVEMTVNDETVPYISEVKRICLQRVGAVCHLIESRDNNNSYVRLTKLPVEKHQKIWESFESPMFHFQQSQWLKKRREFCYAGDWVSSLDVESGYLVPCFSGGNAISYNVFENIDEPIKFCAIGHNCPWSHCQAAHVLLSFGIIPELQAPTYMDFRDRACIDGSHWLTPAVSEFFSSKFIESNAEYPPLKKAFVNRLMELDYPEEESTCLDGSVRTGEDECVDGKALSRLLRKRHIHTLIVWGTGKRCDFLLSLFKKSSIRVLCQVNTDSCFSPDGRRWRRALRKAKWFFIYALPFGMGRRWYEGRKVSKGDRLPDADAIVISDFAHFNSKRKQIPPKFNRVLSITELADGNSHITNNIEYNLNGGGRIHFSVDDVWEPFSHITDGDYHSVFEEPFFAWLKELRARLGISVTLYCFFEDKSKNFFMDSVTARYKAEFESNAGWLHFAFHARNAESSYSGSDACLLAGDYHEGMAQLERIVGKSSLSHTLRLHCWQGSKSEVEKMVYDADYPLAALLTPNDGKAGYYLDAIQNHRLQKDFYLFDESVGCAFYKTDLRIESVADVRRVPYKNLCHTHQRQVSVFTHAWALAEQKVKADTEYVLENLGKLNGRLYV